MTTSSLPVIVTRTSLCDVLLPSNSSAHIYRQLSWDGHGSVHLDWLVHGLVHVLWLNLRKKSSRALLCLNSILLAAVCLMRLAPLYFQGKKMSPVNKTLFELPTAHFFLQFHTHVIIYKCCRTNTSWFPAQIIKLNTKYYHDSARLIYWYHLMQKKSKSHEV